MRITYPRAGNLSTCGQPIRVRITYPVRRFLSRSRLLLAGVMYRGSDEPSRSLFRVGPRLGLFLSGVMPQALAWCYAWFSGASGLYKVATQQCCT